MGKVELGVKTERLGRSFGMEKAKEKGVLV